MERHQKEWKKQTGQRRPNSIKKMIIKRMRISPNWIRTASNLMTSVSSGNIFGDGRKKCVLGVLVIALVILLSLRWQLVCFNYQSQRVIDRQCDAYINGEAHGNMCNIFCNSKNRLKDENLPSYEENASTRVLYPIAGCPNSFHSGKDVVFPGIISGGRRVYVKGYLNSDNIDRVPLPMENEKSILSIEIFMEMIHNYVRDNVGLFNADTNDNSAMNITIQKLFPDMQLENGDPDYTTSMMKTMWSLVQDDEYVISRLSQELSLFPTIYGSCGSLYIVEEIEPLSYDSASWGKEISFKKFGERAIVAMAIMDFLEELDTVFEEPIHLCDIKASHFGISNQGRVKFLDLDAIFAKSILGTTMRQQGSVDEDAVSCKEHSDCSFFDCQGECDKILGKCRDKVANNNLQVVCEKVFLGRKYLSVGNDVGWLFKDQGFLVSKHGNRRLNELLQRCANPSKAKDGVRIQVPKETKVSLYKALEEIVNFAEDSEDA